DSHQSSTSYAVCLLLAASRSRCSSRSSTLAQPRARISLTLAATSALVGVRPCHGSGHLPIALPPLCTGSLGESATQAFLHEVRVQLFSLADATADRPVKLEKLLVLSDPQRIRKLAVAPKEKRAGRKALHHLHHVGGLVEHVEVVLNVIEVVHLFIVGDVVSALGIDPVNRGNLEHVLAKPYAQRSEQLGALER